MILWPSLSPRGKRKSELLLYFIEIEWWLVPFFFFFSSRCALAMNVSASKFHISFGWVSARRTYARTKTVHFSSSFFLFPQWEWFTKKKIVGNIKFIGPQPKLSGYLLLVRVEIVVFIATPYLFLSLFSIVCVCVCKRKNTVGYGWLWGGKELRRNIVSSLMVWPFSFQVMRGSVNVSPFKNTNKTFRNNSPWKILNFECKQRFRYH